MTALYPLKFIPIYKERLWGGNKINTVLGKDYSPLERCGESWEISTVNENISVVANGEHTGKLLTDLINEYKDKLIGSKVYNKFGNGLPLLVKFIDANDDLSVQVHPDDKLAQSRHQSYGKTEMWYIIQADEGANISVGFNQKVDRELYLEKLGANALSDILNYEQPKPGDVYFIPAGRIHYIGKGVLLAEIQQPSDITYRIYDFDRIDSNGQKRELHTELAIDALDFNVYQEYGTSYQPVLNKETPIIECEFFTTNILTISGTKILDYTDVDSFVIHICVSGSYTIEVDDMLYSIKFGECILLPAVLKNVIVHSNDECKVLVTYCGI